MHAWLMGGLGEHGVRRAAKAVDHAVAEVHAALIDKVGGDKEG